MCLKSEDPCHLFKITKCGDYRKAIVKPTNHSKYRRTLCYLVFNNSNNLELVFLQPFLGSVTQCNAMFPSPTVHSTGPHTNRKVYFTITETVISQKLYTEGSIKDYLHDRLVFAKNDFRCFLHILYFIKCPVGKVCG